MIEYKDFHLKDSMIEYLVKLNPQKQPSLVPPKKCLTKTFFERNPNSKWKGTIDRSQLRWMKCVWRAIKLDKIIELPKFINRYGYISSYAYQINEFIKKHEPTRDQTIQLLYMALLQTSQIQFYYIMEKMIEKKGTYKNKNIFHQYEKELENVKVGDEGGKLILNGGPKGRVRPPAMSTFKFLKNKDEKTEKKA